MSRGAHHAQNTLTTNIWSQVSHETDDKSCNRLTDCVSNQLLANREP